MRRDDRAVLVWYTKDWSSNNHKNARVNVDYDHASLVRWSPDSKAFIVKRHAENVVEAYKITKNEGGSIGNVKKVKTYPKFHEEEIVGLGVSANGKYIMSASNKTEIYLWDLKGGILSRIETSLASISCARLSLCGKFIIASGGLVPRATVWEAQFSIFGEFSGTRIACDLNGSGSGICDASFDASASKAATLSDDGTWNAYDLESAEHGTGRGPRMLASASVEREDEEEKVSRIVLSPSGNVVAVAAGSSLSLYNAENAELDIKIRNIFSGPVTCVLFDAQSKYVLVSGDRHVRIFHNVTGAKVSAEVARAKLKQPNNSSALTERLKDQIATADFFVASFST